MKKLAIVIFGSIALFCNFVGCSNNKVENDVCDMGYYYNHPEEIEDEDEIVFVEYHNKSIPLSNGLTRDSVMNLMGKPSFTDTTASTVDRWLYYTNPNHSYYIELRFNNDLLCYIMQGDETTSR